MKYNMGRGFILGMSPLAPLILVVVLTVALSALARQVTVGGGFYLQQWAAGIVVILGLLAGIAALIVFSVRTLRQVKRWQQTGEQVQANAALWGLAVVALVVLLPLLLAIFIPQQPAPNLTP